MVNIPVWVLCILGFCTGNFMVRLFNVVRRIYFKKEKVDALSDKK